MATREGRKPRNENSDNPGFVSEYRHYRTGKLMRGRDYGYTGGPFIRQMIDWCEGQGIGLPKKADIEYLLDKKKVCEGMSGEDARYFEECVRMGARRRTPT